MQSGDFLIPEGSLLSNITSKLTELFTLKDVVWFFADTRGLDYRVTSVEN